MNEHTPYVSRKELRRREAAAAANAAGAGIAPEAEFSAPLPQAQAAATMQPTHAAEQQAVSVPMPTSPLTVSSITPAEAAGAGGTRMPGAAAGLSAARSTDPDTAVRASNTTRARMARAVDRTSTTNPSGRKRKRRTARPTRRETLARGRRAAPLLAMLFIGGLALVTALPANAQFQNSSSVASVNGGMDDDQSRAVTAKFLNGQSLEASAGAAVASRDAVSATTLRTFFGGYTSATYVNNPLGTIQWPFSVTVPITDIFGYRVPPCSWCSSDHKGVDFDTGEGYPFQAIADGVVTKVNLADDNSLGIYVVVTHDVKGMRFESWYAHALPGSIMVSEGQAVTVTQALGQVGDTGASTGSHLHLEIHVNGVPVDPFAWLTANAG
ncbi:MAG: peptidoglycan DD-metalloendopeptidase family protein [Aurantimicrobium sp.]|nr:peptidoglycan DD-metalloendopeptidase family protein [Aurantimicrobium sp.]